MLYNYNDLTDSEIHVSFFQEQMFVFMKTEDVLKCVTADWVWLIAHVTQCMFFQLMEKTVCRLMRHSLVSVMRIKLKYKRKRNHTKPSNQFEK